MSLSFKKINKKNKENELSEKRYQDILLVKNYYQESFMDKMMETGTVGSIIIGYKKTNNIKTNELAIIFGLRKKKLSEDQLFASDIIPKTFTYNEITVKTDVEEICWSLIKNN